MHCADPLPRVTPLYFSLAKCDPESFFFPCWHLDCKTDNRKRLNSKNKVFQYGKTNITIFRSYFPQDIVWPT